MTNARQPIGVAIVICDAVHTDPLSAKRTLLGVFSYLSFESYPIAFKKLTTYLAVTNCIGYYALTLRVTNLADESIIAQEKEIAFNCPDPLEIV